MDQRKHNPFAGDVHGFIIYPASWVKPSNRPYATVKELNAERRAKMHARKDGESALHMMLPTQLGGSIFASPYDRPDPLAAEDAAHRLFTREQQDFATLVDQLTRHHSGKEAYAPHEDYTHVHGIGSWEGNLEPSMMTVFHKPITAETLQRIGAEMGILARQHGILAFSPDPNGTEQLLHMRLHTHSPRERLSPSKIAAIVKPLSEEFQQYYDKTDDGPSFWIPGRTILPNPNGTTDILTWVPPWEKNKQRMTDTFMEIAKKHNTVEPPKFWSGTGFMMGGTSPYSDDEAKYMGDAEKRDLAIANYRKVLGAPKESAAAVPLLPTKLMRGDSTETSLQAAIKAKPLDGGARLAYADFLRDHGDDDAANVHERMGRMYASGSSPIDHAIASKNATTPEVLQLIHEGGYHTLAATLQRPATTTDPEHGFPGLFQSLESGGLQSRWLPITAHETYRPNTNSTDWVRSHLVHQPGSQIALLLTDTHDLKNTGSPSFAHVAHVLDARDATAIAMEHLHNLTRTLQPNSQRTTNSQKVIDASNMVRQLNAATRATQLSRSPAGTGMVVRGVFYPPGEVVPTLQTPTKTTPSSEHPFAKKLREWLQSKKPLTKV